MLQTRVLKPGFRLRGISCNSSGANYIHARKHPPKKKPRKSLTYKAFESVLAVWTRLELATPCVTGMYSNQLNYQTVSQQCCCSFAAVRKDKNFIPSSATLLRHIQKKVTDAAKERFSGHLNTLKIKEKVEFTSGIKSLRFPLHSRQARAPRIFARLTRYAESTGKTPEAMSTSTQSMRY